MVPSKTNSLATSQLREILKKKGLTKGRYPNRHFLKRSHRRRAWAHADDGDADAGVCVWEREGGSRLPGREEGRKEISRDTTRTNRPLKETPGSCRTRAPVARGASNKATNRPTNKRTTPSYQSGTRGRRLGVSRVGFGRPWNPPGSTSQAYYNHYEKVGWRGFV